MNDQQVQLAREIAIKLHKGQLGPAGIDYFSEVISPVSARARRLFGTREEVIALLRGALERTTVTADELVQRGIDPELVRSVVVLTRTKDESYRAFVERVRASGDIAAVRVKLLDLEHASRPLPATAGEARKLYHEARFDAHQLAMVVLSEWLALRGFK